MMNVLGRFLVGSGGGLGLIGATTVCSLILSCDCTMLFRSILSERPSGSVGAGIDDRSPIAIQRSLERPARTASRLSAGARPRSGRDVRWVEPKLVCEVAALDVGEMICAINASIESWSTPTSTFGS